MNRIRTTLDLGSDLKIEATVQFFPADGSYMILFGEVATHKSIPILRLEKVGIEQQSNEGKWQWVFYPAEGNKRWLMGYTSAQLAWEAFWHLGADLLVGHLLAPDAPIHKDVTFMLKNLMDAGRPLDQRRPL